MNSQPAISINTQSSNLKKKSDLVGFFGWRNMFYKERSELEQRNICLMASEEPALLLSARGHRFRTVMGDRIEHFHGTAASHADATHTHTHWVSTAHLPAREKLSNPSWSARGRVTAPDKRTLSEPCVDGGLLLPMCLCLIPSVLSHNWIIAAPPVIPNSSQRFNMGQEFDII